MGTKSSRLSTKKFKQNTESKVKGEIFDFVGVKEMTPDNYEVVSNNDIKHLNRDIPKIEEENVDISEINVSADFLNRLSNKVAAITETLKMEEEPIPIILNQNAGNTLDDLFKNMLEKIIKTEIKPLIETINKLESEIEVLKNKEISFHITTERSRNASKIKGSSLIERDDEDFFS